MSDTGDDLFNFPCPFPIKVMGLSGDGLETLVLDIVKKHAPDTHESDISIRPSKKGKYSAVTATITATSRKQLDTIYLELTACKQILMAL
ncbi:MAG: YbeD family protein [Thiohalomonadales bacterium]